MVVLDFSKSKAIFSMKILCKLCVLIYIFLLLAFKSIGSLLANNEYGTST